MTSMAIWRAAALVFLVGLASPGAAQSASPAAIAALLDRDGAGSAPLHQFYQDRQFVPAWSGNAAAEANAQRMISALAHAGDEGLDPGRYQFSGAIDAAARDIALTRATLAYMSELRSGRPDLKSLDRDVSLPPANFDAVGELESALRQDRLLNFLPVWRRPIPNMPG